MKRFAKTFIIAIMLMVQPMKSWAQVSQLSNASTIKFDITNIANFDERIFFMHSLLNDARFNVINSEEDGIFVISADEAYSGMDLATAFEELRADHAAQFALLDKYEASRKAIRYKANLPNEIVASLMMDYYVRSRTNSTCATSDPFCTDNGMYQFPAGVNSGSGEPGPYYSCLSTTPNPAWYHMRIATPGSITIHMYSTPSVDIDFCCWGPFTDPTTPCPNGLTSDKVVSCSYSTAATENCIIPATAQTGDYFILVITNYSNQTCNISFSKTGGNGTTDCGIMPPVVSNNGPYCAGQTIQLTANGQAGATYSWTGPGGWTSNLQNPTRTNCTVAMSGTYTCTITLGGQTNSATTEVIVHAQPVANAGPDQTIIYGATAQLSGSGGSGTFNYQWSPANMVTNPNSQNTQTVSLTADQTYILTVTNPQGGCTSTDEVTIHISGSNMTVTPGPNEDICEGGSTMIQANAGGGTGNFTFSWTPTTGLSDPTVSNPVASPAQTTTYTCTVSDGMSTLSISVTVNVNMPEFEEETHYICPGDVYDWNGQSCSAEGDYVFNTTTTQGCDKTITLHLHHYPTYDETPINVAICPGESYDFYGTTFNQSVSDFPHTLQSMNGCDSIVRLNLTVWPENELTIKQVSVCPEQLPYTFYGENYYSNTDVTVWDTDIHGCDSAVRLVLSVSEYYKPETQTVYVCSLPYQWEIRDASNTLVAVQTLNEAGYYCDTLPTSACDGIFRLDLYYQQVPETDYTEVVACNSYTWPLTGQTFTQSGDYYHSVSLSPFPCEQVYQLHLTVNYESVDNPVVIDGSNPSIHLCDEYDFYDNLISDTPLSFDRNIDTILNGLTPDGCDYKVRLEIRNMHYTPAPIIRCADQNVESPHFPITATEFNVNRYTYYASDPKSDDTWYNSECSWSISKDSWRIIPSNDNRSCTVYAMDYVDDTIWLTFKAVNRCSGTEGIVAKYWLKPSFYGIEETEAYPAAVSVIPNPNNGQMELRFENMEGKIDVRVCNVSGTLIDSFEVQATQPPYSHSYAMKRLSNGVYFFTFSDGKRAVTKKVVIIH